jgi:hypothetical protein
VCFEQALNGTSLLGEQGCIRVGQHGPARLVVVVVRSCDGGVAVLATLAGAVSASSLSQDSSARRR